MKFNGLKIQDASLIEDGAWLHLSNPEDDEPLYLDPETKKLPCRVKVRSDQSQTHKRNAFKFNSANQHRYQRAKAGERAAIEAKAVEERMDLNFISALVGLDNADAGAPGYQPADDEGAAAILADPSLQWMVNQVLVFSANGANYGIKTEVPPGAGEKAGGKTPASKTSPKA